MRISQLIQWAAWIPFLATVPGCLDMGEFKEGLRAEQAGEYHRAYDIYCKAANDNRDNRLLAMCISRTAPQAATYWEDRAHQAVDRGQYAEAWQLFMRVLEIRPDHPSAPHLIRRLERDHPDAVMPVRMAYQARGDKTLLASAARSTSPQASRPVASLEPWSTERPRIAGPVETPRIAATPNPSYGQPDDEKPLRTAEAVQTPSASAPPERNEPIPSIPSNLPASAAQPRSDAGSPATPSGAPLTTLPSDTQGETVRSSATVSKRIVQEPTGSAPPRQREIVQERESVRRYRDVRQDDRNRRPPPPVAARRPAPLFSAPPPPPKPQAEDDNGDKPAPTSQFLLVRSLSKKGKDFPKKAEMVDGLIVELRDTDDDGTVDLTIYIGSHRISKVGGIHVGEAVLVSGRSGRAYELAILSIVDSRKTARIGVRPSKRADLLYQKRSQ